MNSKLALIVAVFIASFFAGACDIWFASAKGTAQMAVLWLPVIVISLLIFAWVHIDASERKYRKSPLLNLGIIGLASVFVPIYLYKSRPNGSKASALGLFFALLFGYFAISYAGSALAQYVSL